MALCSAEVWVPPRRQSTCRSKRHMRAEPRIEQPSSATLQRWGAVCMAENPGSVVEYSQILVSGGVGHNQGSCSTHLHKRVREGVVVMPVTSPVCGVRRSAVSVYQWRHKLPARRVSHLSGCVRWMVGYRPNPTTGQNQPSTLRCTCSS
jgi:hypothetical protein